VELIPKGEKKRKKKKGKKEKRGKRGEEFRPIKRPPLFFHPFF